MDTEIKDKWIQALRSGEYPQTKGRLRDDKGYCCLGVLCDLIDPDGWSYHSDGWCFDMEGEQLPAALCAELGIDTVGYIDVLYESLAEMNDSGDSFDAIADIIERHL